VRYSYTGSGGGTLTRPGRHRPTPGAHLRAGATTRR
jgi:hypothetical protein